MKPALKQTIATRFSVIASIGQSNITVKSSHLNINPLQARSRTRASITSIGSELRVNPSFFPEKEVEKRVVTYIHEAAHLGMGGEHHKPAFWNQLTNILNKILTNPTHQDTIQSVFTKDIDWYKVRYRAVQDVSEECVDKRMETVEERKRKLARAMDGYDEDTAEFFDIRRYSWRSGDADTFFYDDDYSESFSLSELNTSASEYTDTELKQFIEEQATKLTADHISFESPITYTRGSIREYVDYEYAYYMAAIADRRGMDYCPMTIGKAVVDEVYEFDVDENTRLTLENSLEY